MEDSLQRLRTDRIDVYHVHLAGSPGAHRGDRGDAPPPVRAGQDSGDRREQLLTGPEPSGARGIRSNWRRSGTCSGGTSMRTRGARSIGSCLPRSQIRSARNSWLRRLDGARRHRPRRRRARAAPRPRLRADPCPASLWAGSEMSPCLRPCCSCRGGKSEPWRG
jgi:hypothetical protein